MESPTLGGSGGRHEKLVLVVASAMITAVLLAACTHTSISPDNSGADSGQPFLGVLLEQAITRAGVSGALVSAVIPDSPAQKCGILPGDVIQMFDNEPIYSPDDLIKAVSRKSTARDVLVRVRRGARDMNLEASIVLQP